MSTNASGSEDLGHFCLLHQYVDDNRYYLKQRLGSGGYSVVYLADDLHSPSLDQVAIKCMRRTSKTTLSHHYSESLLHDRASQVSGVVKFLRSIEEDDYLFIVLEYCPSGDLFHMITEDQLCFRNDDIIKTVFIQILDAVQGLHDLSIYHRDLKPENIMCKGDGLEVVITDFGLATEFDVTKDYGYGSLHYMTPECIGGRYSRSFKGYSSRASDIWAMGIILVNMITMRSPWKDATPSDPTFMLYTRNPEAFRRLLPISEAAFNFLDRIFRYHGHTVTIADLRDEFLEIDTFYAPPGEVMDEEEFFIPTVVSNSLCSSFYQRVDSDSDVESILGLHSSDDEETPIPTFQIVDEDISLFSVGSDSSSGDEPQEAVTPENNPLQLPDTVPDLPGGEHIVGRFAQLAIDSEKIEKIELPTSVRKEGQSSVIVM